MPTETNPAPRWQQIVVGQRVISKSKKKRGTVIAVMDWTADGMSTHVMVRWDAAPQWQRLHATHGLIVIDETAEDAFPGTDEPSPIPPELTRSEETSCC